MIPRLRRALKDEDGNATIEYVMWLPIIIAIITGAFDLNTILFVQSNMWDVARDTARRITIDELTSASAADYAVGRLNSTTETYTVTVSEADDVTVVIQRTMEGMSVLGMVGTFRDYQIEASVTMRDEP